MSVHRSAFCLVLLSAHAFGGDLVVSVVDARGGAVSDAVVTVRGEGDGSQPLPAAVTKTIDQRHETFVPYVEIFRPGDQVVFRNSDHTHHHVYSFASAKSFEFVIAPGRSAPAITLDQIGEIAVGCNIHDRMIAHLYISDASHIAKSGADGRVMFADLPAGPHTVQVWHPQLRPGRPGPQQTVTLDSAVATLGFSLTLLPDPRAGAGDPERIGY